MIEMSDNDAATSLWDMVGGSSGVQAFDSSVGLTQTTPSTCVECPGFPWPGWGLSTTTPEDQLTLLRLLVQPNAVLSSQERSVRAESDGERHDVGSVGRQWRRAAGRDRLP